MSRKLINKYSEALRGTIPNKEDTSKKPSKGSADPYKLYKESLKSKEPLDVIFSYIAPNGDLSVKDSNGISLVLKGNILSDELSYYDGRRRGLFLGAPFTVKVDSIDEETGIVYVKNGRETRSSVKNQIVRELVGELKAGEDLVVSGRVVKVSDKSALVDLMGKGILGICDVSKWSKAYVRYLREVCHEDDVLDFKVTRLLPKLKGRAQAFELSRVDISPDPWLEIPKDSAEIGAVMVVKCVDKPKGKTYWWGTSPMIPGIEIMGDYTVKFGKDGIIRNIHYKCKVIRVDFEKHIFQVVPFQVADADADTVNAVRRVRSKEKVK